MTYFSYSLQTYFLYTFVFIVLCTCLITVSTLLISAASTVNRNLISCMLSSKRDVSLFGIKLSEGFGKYTAIFPKQPYPHHFQTVLPILIPKLSDKKDDTDLDNLSDNVASAEFVSLDYFTQWSKVRKIRCSGFGLCHDYQWKIYRYSSSIFHSLECAREVWIGNPIKGEIFISNQYSYSSMLVEEEIILARNERHFILSNCSIKLFSAQLCLSSPIRGLLHWK